MKFVKKLTGIGASVAVCSIMFGAEAGQIEKNVSEQKLDNVKMSDSKVDTVKTAINTEVSEARKDDYLKTYGWVTFMQSGIKNFGLTDKELEKVVEGVKMAAKGQESPCALGEVMEDLQKFFQEKASAYAKIHQEEIKKISEKNRKEGKEYMDNLLKKHPSIKVTESGLGYEILAAGDEKNKPTDSDSVEIRYVGKLINGKIFDESKGKSITFPVNGVVAGIKEGIQLIGNGGKIVLYIPCDLGYGEFDIPSIPAGSLLIFELELVNIVKLDSKANVDAPSTAPAAEKQVQEPVAK